MTVKLVYPPLHSHMSEPDTDSQDRKRRSYRMNVKLRLQRRVKMVPRGYDNRGEQEPN